MIYLGNVPVGIPVGVNGISIYQKLTAQPSSNAVLSFDHNLGVVPKRIVISPASGSSVTQGKFERYGLTMIADDLGVGAGIYKNSSDENTYGNRSNYRSSVGTYNSVFSLSTTSVSIRQQSSSVGWDSSATYQVELWG